LMIEMAADSMDELLAPVGSQNGSLFRETTMGDGEAHSSEDNRRQ
jgi:hypothetical protein